MSWQAVAWAMRKGKDYELEPVTRFVMLTLANYADPEGNDIFPSLATLEGDTGLSERTIRRHIKTLIAVKLLDYGDQSVVTDNPRYRNDHLPKVYRFLFERDDQGVPDFGNFGKLPSSKQRPDRKSTRENTEENVVQDTNDRTESPERPDRESGTTGQTGGQRVHQTYKPPIEPTEPTADELEAGRRLREEIRNRNARRGTFARATP